MDKKQDNRDNSEEVKKLKTLEERKGIMRDKELFDLAKIEHNDWYMGMLSRDDVEPYLKNINDYAVRAVEQRNLTELVLSINGGPLKNDGKELSKAAIFHITLICDKFTKKWSLTAGAGTKSFSTVTQLIEHYQKNYLPMPPPYANCIRLENPCKRPKWLLKRQFVEFNNKCHLGSGNFCDVYKGKIKKRNTDVAIKVCHAINDKKNGDQVDKEILARDALIKEGQLMQTVRHPNVIKFYGICCDKPPVMIVMELCPGGSLLNHLVKFNDKITVGERLKYSVEAADGMAYLHEKNLIHRDLAARNCLISRYGAVKIADFGLSKLLSDIVPGGDTTAKMQIPLRWMAPESLQREPIFSDKSDVWAYGMMLFEIFGNGQKPWEDWEHKKIATYIRRVQMPNFADKTPPQVRELVKEKIWVLDPAKRSDFRGISVVLTQLQKVHPCPKPEETMLHQIPGVEVLSKEEIQQYKEDENSDDIMDEVRSSIMSNPHDVMPANDNGLACERDITIEDAPMSPAAKKSASTPKRPSTVRKNRKASGSADNSRDATQELASAEQNTVDEKKKASKHVQKRKFNPSIEPMSVTPNQMSGEHKVPSIDAPIHRPAIRRR